MIFRMWERRALLVWSDKFKESEFQDYSLTAGEKLYSLDNSVIFQSVYEFSFGLRHT